MRWVIVLLSIVLALFDAASASAHEKYHLAGILCCTNLLSWKHEAGIGGAPSEFVSRNAWFNGAL
jgi:hypothetical protein